MLSALIIPLILVVVVADRACANNNGKPHIIVIVADDMGSNDVSFHGSNEIPTPNIDALAYNGVILNAHYTQAMCTPSRAAFLTGKYPFHLGMQHLVIREPEPSGLPLNETTMPQLLQRHNYKTHAIGKWHLGFYKKEFTPTFRGFDSHFGCWQGYQDYYSHNVQTTYGTEIGYDMRRNMSIDWSAKGKYSTQLFTEHAVQLINEHDANRPMFMYLAHIAPHAGLPDDPLQAPDEYIARFAHIQDPARRIYAAMVSLLDESVGEVVKALRDKRMLENSIILFMSDNGGVPVGKHANHGSNYPLRGMKMTNWEGGVRNLAAIWSPLIKQPQRVSNELIHISDWLPTFYSAAGLNISELGAIDGKDVWMSISENTKSPRADLIYNIDDVWENAAVRQGHWKYINGSIIGGKLDDWFGSTGANGNYTYNPRDVLFSPTGIALSAATTCMQFKRRTSHTTVDLLTTHKIHSLREQATIRCASIPLNDSESGKCDPGKAACLFNLEDDPCERVNLATVYPIELLRLENFLMEQRVSAARPINRPMDPNADPVRWNGVWTNWMDVEDDRQQTLFMIIVIASIIIVHLLLFILFKRYGHKLHLNRYFSLLKAQEKTTNDFVLEAKA